VDDSPYRPFAFGQLFRELVAMNVPVIDVETIQWEDNFFLHEMKIGPIEFDEKGRIRE